MRNGTRRIGPRAAAVALVLLAAALVAGCTKDMGEPVAEVGAQPDEAALVDWIGKVHEIAVLCSEHSATADGSLDAQGALTVAQDHNAEVISVSGQAIEHCDYALDGNAHQPTADDLGEIWAEGTEAFESWLDAMGKTHRSAVIVAAGNGDSRPLVAELFTNQHEADHLADELDELVAGRAAALDLDWPEDGLGLHRWNPPAH